MSAAGRKRKAHTRRQAIRELNADPVLTDRSLRWPVVAGGYEWVRVNNVRVLTENGESRKCSEPQFRLYTLGDGFNLFRQFAQAQPTEAGFKQFADEHGRLGVDPAGTGLGTVHVPAARAGEPGNVIGEPFGSWRLAHLAVAEAWRIWSTTRARKGTRQPRLEELVNEELERHIATRLSWSETRRKYGFRFYPTTLLGCMWLAFSRTALTGESRFRQCGCCPILIEIAKGARTDSTKFCSVVCRMRAYRKRQKTKPDKD